MDIKELYDKLDKIFTEYTTHQWKNGWQHEGDRLSKKLTIQNNIPWNNLFLLHIESRGFCLDGPIFKIEVKKENDNTIRIDIEYKQMADLDIYYYVDNELDWLAQQEFIIDLCQKVYDANVLLRESISIVPTNIYGEHNPNFVKPFRRERQLNELGI
jgi:hypothetical protein